MQDLDDILIGKEDSADNDDRRFKEGWDSDHLMTPFQCVECHFINIKGRRMDRTDSRDQLAKIAITRAILDSLWAQERSTINSNCLEGARLLHIGFPRGLVSYERTFPKEGCMGHVTGLRYAG